ncbi:type IV pilus modification protein PilV [Neptuniibacter caesariensis]|uniref:Probable type-4 fimbrial biogenesis protein n=1 Tax=Neptuniibacter caesariensis TaxID=207954 RepID=A0A7U8C7W0_NEPCE|nr:type IV pilus modification protein PilV [Neptuniibacter caesariensis]EAR61474.1 probable type-4 fimbrial biogenesis protein [Oceanospirillum sp. MED92] [Neptuniibacter caesariensis]
MRRQLGFNLIEVMIALVVISIGLLGLAALQMTSLQQNQSAYFRSQATLFAYDIADRMRANQTQADAGAYYVVSGATESNCINYSGSASGCTAAQMASHDIAEWQAAIAAELPEGGGRVCRSDLTGDAVEAPDCEADNSNNPTVVYVWWNDDKSASGATTQLTVSVEL